MIGTNYKCEICGEETSNPMRWFVIHCSDSKLHFCGEGHAQVYISRWFESFCGSRVMLGSK